MDTVTLEITPPGPPETAPWWTVTWNGSEAEVESAPGLEDEHPTNWGISCTTPRCTNAWLAEGGDGYVIEQVVKGFTEKHAKARIVSVRGRMTGVLTEFVAANPNCATELRDVVET